MDATELQPQLSNPLPSFPSPLPIPHQNDRSDSAYVRLLGSILFFPACRTTSEKLTFSSFLLVSFPVQKDKGGDPELVRESQRKRGASVELVDDVLARYTAWTKREYGVSKSDRTQRGGRKEGKEIRRRVELTFRFPSFALLPLFASYSRV